MRSHFTRILTYHGTFNLIAAILLAGTLQNRVLNLLAHVVLHTATHVLTVWWKMEDPQVIEQATIYFSAIFQEYPNSHEAVFGNFRPRQYDEFTRHECIYRIIFRP